MGLPKNYLSARRALEDTNPAPARPRIQVTAAADGARVNIYDEIGPWGVNAADFVRDFTALALTATSTVDVHINSPGGDVYDGLAIYQALKASPATVNVHIDGLAASAASFIAMAGDSIEIGRNARMMIHDASTIVYGNAADMRETAAWLDEESNNIADIYAQQAGGDVADWRAIMVEERWYSAEQALAAGLATSIHGADAAVTRSVAASLFKNAPGGPAQPADTIHTDDVDPHADIDFGQVSTALKGALQ